MGRPGNVHHTVMYLWSPRWTRLDPIDFDMIVSGFRISVHRSRAQADGKPDWFRNHWKRTEADETGSIQDQKPRVKLLSNILLRFYSPDESLYQSSKDPKNWMVDIRIFWCLAWRVSCRNRSQNVWAQIKPDHVMAQLVNSYLPSSEVPTGMTSCTHALQSQYHQRGCKLGKGAYFAGVTSASFTSALYISSRLTPSREACREYFIAKSPKMFVPSEPPWVQAGKFYQWKRW